MKVKVLRKFRDKHTRIIYLPDDTFDIDEARLAEINSTKNGMLAEPCVTSDAEGAGTIPAPVEEPETTPVTDKAAPKKNAAGKAK
ncbi:hypothetical protein LJC74_03860 [Eubacteriales bacterium OttesenSCG-928-A19]|nr:hypothetical protein [Eubacteriales bacterium OttesenSCG-928-A19]